MSANGQTGARSCWAAVLGDCDQKLSREHVVSRCLFEFNEIVVQGFPWCLNEPKSIGLSNLVAKILCKKHNSNLSELDSVALTAFNAFRQSIHLNNVRGRMKKPSAWNVKIFRIDGPRFERWFLKTLINLSFGKEWPIGTGSHPDGTATDELVEAAFGLRELGHGAGLISQVKLATK